MTSKYVKILYFLQMSWIFFLMPLTMIYLFGSANILKAIAFVVLPRVGHGGLFYTFSQVSHIQDEATQIKVSDSWIVHQIESCVDYSTTSLFWNVMSIGLNNQTLHHLFPSVHPCHFVELSPILDEFCADHNIKRNMVGNLWDALMAHFGYLGAVNDENDDTTD